MTKKEEIKETLPLVFKELPKQEIKEYVGEDGNKYICIPEEEALTELLVNSRQSIELLENIKKTLTS